MTPDSRRVISIALAALGHDQLEQRLCETCAELLVVSGVGVAVVTADGHRLALRSSDATATALQDLQDTLGEGPSIDAYRVGVPVGEADLADPRRTRWPAFAAPAVAAGAAAVFAFPMRVGGARLGVLTVYQAQRGRLGHDQYTNAVVVADVVTHAILALQAGSAPGVLAGALEHLGTDRVEVHQASGMVAARLGVGVGEALVRLRAHAYAEGRPLADVARDVVARRLRLE